MRACARASLRACVCVFAGVHACVNACMRVCVRSWVRPCVCLHACVHACERASERECVRVFVCACTCVRVCDTTIIVKARGLFKRAAHCNFSAAATLSMRQ